MKKILWTVALVLAAVGILRGDMAAVLQKAGLICLECIGLG